MPERRQHIYAITYNRQDKARGGDNGDNYVRHHRLDSRSPSALGGAHNAYAAKLQRRRASNQRNTESHLPQQTVRRHSNGRHRDQLGGVAKSRSRQAQVEGENPLPEESGTPDNQKRAEGKAGRPHHSPDPQATFHLHNDNA